MLWRTAGEQVKAHLHHGAYRLRIKYRTSQTHRSRSLYKEITSTDERWETAGHPCYWPTKESALAYAGLFERFVQRGLANPGGGGSRSLVASETPPSFAAAAASPSRRSKRSAEASWSTDICELEVFVGCPIMIIIAASCQYRVQETARICGIAVRISDAVQRERQRRSPDGVKRDPWRVACGKNGSGSTKYAWSSHC